MLAWLLFAGRVDLFIETSGGAERWFLFLIFALLAGIHWDVRLAGGSVPFLVSLLGLVMSGVCLAALPIAALHRLRNRQCFLFRKTWVFGVNEKDLWFKAGSFLDCVALYFLISAKEKNHSITNGQQSMNMYLLSRCCRGFWFALWMEGEMGSMWGHGLCSGDGINPWYLRFSRHSRVTTERCDA